MAQAIQLDLALAMLPYDADRIAERRALATEAERALAHVSGAFFDTYARFNLVPLLLVEGEWGQVHALLQEAAARFAHGALHRMASRYLAQLARDEGDGEAAWGHIRAVLPAGPDTPPGGERCYVATAMQRQAAALALDAGDAGAARAWLEAHDRWLTWSGGDARPIGGEGVMGSVLPGDGRHGAGRRARARGAGRRHGTPATARPPRRPPTARRTRYRGGTIHGRPRAHRHIALPRRCLRRALTSAPSPSSRSRNSTRRRASGPMQARSRRGARPLRPARCQPDARPRRRPRGTPRRDEDAPPVYPAGLSAREVEVLRLLASGKTNREMAAALFLSERTIDAHVRNIFTKTRTDNRAAATAFAYRHDLA